MTRRELREAIFILLFQSEFYSPVEMEEQETVFFEEETEDISEQDRDYISSKFAKIREKSSEIDTMLNERSQSWSTERMGKVDLAILRLAVYELLFDEDIPTAVAINEAVELARKYGQDASPVFVNGVLASFA